MLIVKHIMLYCGRGYMFRSLHDHHQAYFRIKLIDAGYMLGSQLCLQFIQGLLCLLNNFIKFKTKK